MIRIVLDMVAFESKVLGFAPETMPPYPNQRVSKAIPLWWWACRINTMISPDINRWL